MNALKNKTVVSIFALLISLCCEAQSNVYSVAVYAGGTSYRELCSVAFPFAPYKYRLEERSWGEDASGFTIMDLNHKKGQGDVLRRFLGVECGSETFTIQLDSLPPKKVKGGPNPSGKVGSGDLVPLVMRCAASRGGHVNTNALPSIQAKWVRHSRDSQETIIVENDHFTEVEKFLAQAYGAADPAIRSSTPIGDGRSLMYTPRQIGVLLNVTADSRQTIVAIIGKQKP